MKRARTRFPGPDPAYGGLVVGEAYRVDQDRAAQRGPFDPRDRRSWGMGGKAPLLIDPCHEGSTHALVFAGSNGFKTTSAAIPTLLTWTGAAVVLDPSREIGPMLQDFREARPWPSGRHPRSGQPPHPAASTCWTGSTPTAPLAETHVEAVVGWISGETRGPNHRVQTSSATRRASLITCLLDRPAVGPRPAAGTEDAAHPARPHRHPGGRDARRCWRRISQQSHSLKARQLASTLKGATKETYSGIYQNATSDTGWLSTAAYADLVSGSTLPNARPDRRQADRVRADAAACPDNTPALGRVIIGALLNAVYEADGARRRPRAVPAR